jgi:HD-GYP domain-containing protein (c-di-GMP phosphodiesterase class II)
VTDRIELLLREMQTSVGLRLLYPAEHPRIRESVDRILALLREIGSVIPEVSVFAVDDRVIFDGAPLPGGAPLARGLFSTLRACGYDRLTLRRNAAAQEIEDFLAACAESVRRAGRTTSPLRSSAGVRLAALQVTGGEPETPRGNGVFAIEVASLQDVWSTVLEGRPLDLDTLEGIVLALSKTVEENLGALLPVAALKSHDEYTATHITNVGLLSMALAEALGMTEGTVRDLGIAALLHDIGKLKVPDAILTKPDRLDAEQQAAMRRHPEEGARVLLATPGVPELAVAVAYEHHLRYDGGGYPPVPRGWKTTLASAITQVADIYDALRTDRPYRRGHPHAVIEQMMLADSGAIFDPELLDVFFDVVVAAGFNAPRKPLEGD